MSLFKAHAATVVIEPRVGGQNTSWYSEIAGNWANSSATVTVSPATGGTIGSRFASTNTAAFRLAPTLISGHTYIISNAVPASSAAANIVLAISSTDCTGLPATTTAFNNTSLNTWRYVGTFTADSANPTITFAYSSGLSNRLYAAAFLFYDTGGCQTPAVGGLDGPIFAGQTTVAVNGCSPTATSVFVYANNDGTHATCIGTNDAPGGLTTVPVTVSPLVARQRLQASQIVNGCEGTPPVGTTGPVVGDNTNGAINICLEFAGVNGADNLIWLGASGRTGNFGSPPTGATAIQPSPGWQTLTWVPGTSPAWNWGTASAYTFPSTGSANLADIWFSSEDNGAVGPYAVYVDNIKNGDTVLKDWESDLAGNSSFMNQPNFASTGTTALESTPNTTLCVKTNADVGTACQRMDWEWLNLGPNSVRGNLKTPVAIDLTKPITMRVLLLPANASAPALTISQPGPIIARAGVATNLTLVATDHTGAGTLNYTWLKNGVPIDAGNAGELTGYDSAVLHFPNPVTSDAGNYACLVTNTATGSLAGTYASGCNLIAVSFAKGDQQIQFGPLADRTYGDAPFAVSATTPSGLPLSYAIESGPATINGDTVTVTGTGQVTVRALQAGDENWNAATPVDQSFTVQARPVTPAITVADKEYDGELAATIATRSLIGVVGSDDVNLGTSGVAHFTNKQVGPTKAVTASGFALSGDTGSNYVLSVDSASASAAITSRGLTVTATVPDKLYDANRSATATLGDNRVAGDILNLLYGKAEFADRQVGPAKAVSVTGIMVTGPDADNYSFNTTVDTTAAITALPLTVSGILADNKPFGGTTNATIHTAAATIATVLSGDEVALDATNAVGAFRDPDVGDGKPVDVTNLVLFGADAGNYSISPVVLTADIKFALGVTGILAPDRLYDGTLTEALDFTDAALTGIQSGDDVALEVAGASGAFLDKNVGPSKTVVVSGLTLSGNDAGKYLLTPVTTNASISARTLTVSAIAFDKTYDGLLTASIGLSDDRVQGDQLSLAYTAATFTDKNAGHNKPVDVTGISVSGSDGGNYSYNTSAGARATILALPLTVSGITAGNKPYDGDTNATIDVTLAKLETVLSGDDVTLDTTNALGAFRDSAVGDGKPVDIWQLAIRGADTNNYSLAPTVLTADIKFALSVTGLSAADRPYDGTKVAALDFSLAALSGIQSGDEVDLDYSAAAGTFADKWVGTGKTVIVSGLTLNGRDAGKYLLTRVQTNASISARALDITAAVPDKVYDGTLTATATLSDDRVAGDALTVSFATAEFSDQNVGPAKLVSLTGITVSGLDADNYSCSSSLTTNAAITRASLTVTAQDASRVFSAPDPVFQATYSGLMPTDTVAVVSGLPAFATTAAVDSSPGEYQITPSLGNLSADNYRFDTFTAGKLTVLAAESATVLSTSTNPATAGSNVTFTAALSPVAPATLLPTGPVVFCVNGVPFGTNLLAAGSASVATDTLPVGTNLVSALYAGDGNFIGSTNSLQQIVNPAITLSQTNVALSVADNYDGTLTLRFQGTPLAQYYVILSGDPAATSGSWTILDGSTNTASASDGSWSVTIPHSQPQEFYRSVAIHPAP